MNQRQVTFQEAVRMAINKNYCNFSGRASRSEFWWFFLFSFLLSVAISFVCSILGFSVDSTSTVTSIVGLVLILPGLGLWWRRLHDTGHSGLWFLLVFTGIGIILLIFWACIDSQQHPNEYGAVPNVVP